MNFLLLVMISSLSFANVATQSLFNISEIENPAALKIKNQKSHLVYQTLSGSGTYNQGQLEREKITLTESKGLLGFAGDNYAMQLLFLPKQEKNIDEITQYSRATAQHLDEGIQIQFANLFLQNWQWGLGFLSHRKTIDTVKAQTYKVKTGLSYMLTDNWRLGMAAILVNSVSEFEQNRSWIESHTGVSWMKDLSDWGLRAEISYGRSPKVYQKPNKDIGGNYQREWTLTRTNLEFSYDFFLMKLCAGIDQKSKRYASLEAGEAEIEIEQNIFAGLLFFKDRFGIYAGQIKKTSRLASTQTTLNSNSITTTISF